MNLREAIEFTNEWYPCSPEADWALNAFMEAVERVRTLCESRTGLIGAHVVFVTDVLRALDGEEGGHTCDPIECGHPEHGPMYPPGHPEMRE